MNPCLLDVAENRKMWGYLLWKGFRGSLPSSLSGSPGVPESQVDGRKEKAASVLHTCPFHTWQGTRMVTSVSPTQSTPAPREAAHEFHPSFPRTHHPVPLW